LKVSVASSFSLPNEREELAPLGLLHFNAQEKEKEEEESIAATAPAAIAGAALEIVEKQGGEARELTNKQTNRGARRTSIYLSMQVCMHLCMS
jgi:hypothetical protein